MKLGMFRILRCLPLATIALAGCLATEEDVAEDDLTAATFHGVRVESADQNLPDVDAIGYDFDLDAAPTPDGTMALSGTLRATFVATRSLDRFSLDYTGKGTIKSVRNGTKSVAFERKTNTLDVVLAKPVAIGKAFTLSIEFDAMPERNAGAGERTRGLTFDNDRELYTANWPNRARQWFPCRDNPRDAALFAVTLRTPSPEHVVIANGKRSEKSLAGGKRETLHEMLHPIPTYAFFVGVSTKWTREASPVPGAGELETYLEGAAASRTKKRKGVFDNTDEAYAYFSKTFAPYAWETLKFVEVPTTWGGGGMEHVGAISIDPADFSNLKNARVTMIHELAHQWSGDLVRIASWNDFWISEGFTEYLTRRFVEDHDGVAAANALWDESIRGGRSAAHALRPSGDLERDPSPRVIMGAIFDNVAYDKGAWVMRVLEQKVGRDKFTAFLKTWFTKHRHQAVDTQTFEQDLKAFTGKDFTAFFQSAVYGTANPE
jgi:aminopeptidase N